MIAHFAPLRRDNLEGNTRALLQHVGLIMHWHLLTTRKSITRYANFAQLRSRPSLPKERSGAVSCIRENFFLSVVS